MYFGAKLFAESKYELEDDKKEKHVAREEVEKEIKDMLEYNSDPQNVNARKFAVTSGTRGVGKSHSIAAALKDRKGAVLVSLKIGNTDSIEEKICKKFGLGNGSDQFEALMEEVNKTIRPIVVIEIENGTAPEIMKSVEVFAKNNCVDFYKSMVYIVPSDNTLTDVLHPDNKDRRHLIWVGPMTVDEAKKLLEKYPGFKMGDTGIKDVRMRLLRLVVRAIQTSWLASWLFEWVGKHQKG